jgi:hypothetical protein
VDVLGRGQDDAVACGRDDRSVKMVVTEASAAKSEVALPHL